MNRSNLQRRLMSSAAIAAGLMALALGGAAHAQGVNGSAQVTSGSASVVNTPNQTTVTTGGSKTIINWQPTDTAPTGAPIDFLPAGGTLSFYGTGNYTVLNRFIAVNPVTGAPIPISRQIQMAGTVNSFIGNPNASVGNVQGGNIWFYNAGGFLISSTGVINVGSLVLTSNDIDTTGGFLSPGGAIRFRGAPGSTSTVQIDRGASVNVSNPLGGSAYAAIVAPRVVQRGFVNVDGSVAYVAAEQADIRISNGLFDINVLVGAEGGTVIDHSGVTTGAAPADADGYNSGIYMVAMPKNDAVTMLVGGQIGYLDPVTAQIEPNGAIRLAAGYNVIDGEITTNPGSAAPANLVMRDVIFNSELRARASNNLDAAPIGIVSSGGGNVAAAPPPQTGLLRFNKAATLTGDNSATISVGNQQAVVAGSDLTLISGGRDGNPGLAQVSLNYNPALAGNRPLILVGGGLLLDASTTVDTFSGGDAAGGTARISVNGGLLGASSIRLVADATAGFGTAAQGGNATGGTAELIVDGPGAIVNTTSVNLSADGTGGGRRFNQNINGLEASQQGGSANGGTAIVSVSNGAALTAAQGIAIEAKAQGGTGSLVSGDATGGTARLSVASPASQVTSAFTFINTNASGGSFFNASPVGLNSERGGNGTGGTSEIVTDGTVDLGSTFLFAEGTGGNANTGAFRGGDGFGGAANLLATGGTVLLSNLTVDIDGLAGGGSADPANTASIHGEGRGGGASIRTDGATITVNGNVNITGSGNTASGAGINTLRRDGGDVEIRANNGGAILIAGSLAVQVDAGFDPTLGADETSNQQATGGTIRVSAVDGATISAVGLDLTARAYTSTATGTVGAATGGDVTLEASSNGQILSGAGGSFINTSGLAGSGPIGGRGVGGNVDIVADGGRVNLGASSQIDANGTSGVSSSPITGALGQGGKVRLQTTNTPGPSEILIGDLIVNTTGESGEIEEGGLVVAGNTAGDGQGGQFTIDMNGGHIVGSTLNASAAGFGGASNTAQSGGVGSGGSVILNITAGLLDVDTIQVTANGQGDRGGSGQRSGDGFGGTVIVNVDGGTIDTNSFSATATGTGGAGRAGVDGAPFNAGDGGDGEGGSVSFNANSGTVTAGTITLSAGGTGGTGGSYDAMGLVAQDTGDGGSGSAGDARFALRGAAVTANLLTVMANGQGGAGGALLNGAGATGAANGGDGGNGTGGQSTLLIAGNTGNIAQFGASATGIGGTGASAMVGGDGGGAQGGTAEMIVDGVNAGAISVNINARSSGGNGGSGSNGSGGDGGDASGGTARLTTAGAAASVMLDPNILNLEVTGGRGGNGARNAALAAPAGGANGGDGGQAFGGAIELVASGGTLALIPRAGASQVEVVTYTRGGDGGNAADSSAGDIAGDGGSAIGNAVRLLARGGTISSGGAPVRIATGGQTSNGGSAINSVTGANVPGLGNLGFGGTIAIRTEQAASGNSAINLGPTTLVLNSAFGGGIEIRNQVAGDAIQFAGLNVNIAGRVLTNPGAFIDNSGLVMDAGPGQIVVNGDVLIQTRSNAVFAASNSGGILVNGDFYSSTEGRTDVFHTARTGNTATVRATGGLGFYASDISASDGLAAQAGGDLSVIGVNSVALGDVVSSTNIEVGSTGNIVVGRTMSSGNVTITSDSAVTLNGPANAGGNIALRGASLTFGELAATNAITLEATASGITSNGPLRAGTDLTVTAAGPIAIADARAGDDIRLTGGGMTFGDLRATGTGADNEGDGSDFVIASTGNVTIDHAEARSDFRANAARFATGLNSIITGGNIGIVTAGDSLLGNSTAGGSIVVNAGGQIGFAALNSGLETSLSAATDITGATIVSGRDVNANGGAVAINNINAGNDIIVRASGNATIGAATAARDIFITSDAIASLGLTNAGRMLGVSGVRTLGSAAWSAGEDMLIHAIDEITVGNLSAGGRMGLISGDIAATSQTATITTGNLTSTGTANDSGFIDLLSGRPSGTLFFRVLTGPAATDGITVLGRSATTGIVRSRGDVDFVTLGNINVNGTVTSTAGHVELLAGQNVFVGVPASGSLTVGDVTAAQYVNLGIGNFVTSIATGNINAGTYLVAQTSNGNVTMGNVNVGTDLSIGSFAGTGDVVIGNVTAGDDILIQAGNRLTVGNVESTGLGDDTDPAFSFIVSDQVGRAIRLRGGTSIVAGNVTSPGRVIFFSPNGSVTAQTILAPQAIMAFARGDISFGPVTTAGHFFVGDSSLYLPNFANLLDVYDPGLLATLSPTRTAGRLSINGPLSAGEISVFTSGATSIAGLTQAAGRIRIDTGESVALGGDVTSGGDITINALGSIGLGKAKAATSLTLLSGADIAFTALTSGAAMSVTAATSITGERFDAGGDASFIARGGDVAIIPPAAANVQPSTADGNLVMRGTQVRFNTITVAGNADIDAATLLSGAGLTVGGVTVLDADSGAIDLALSSAGAVTATADTANLRGTGTGTLNIAQITTDVGGATVVSQNDLVVQNATLAGSSRFEAINGEVAINQATVTSGNFEAKSGRYMTLGTITAQGDVTATAAESLFVRGAVTATNIVGNSSDIVIGANGRLGTLGRTQSILLANNDRSAPTYIGGTGTRNGWHLDATEITRLFGASIGIDGGRITAPGNVSVGSSNPVDVFVDDFTVDAAQQFGPTGSFVITTPGKLRVVGDARFTNMGDGQTFAITANDALEVIMGDGSVVLTGAGTELGGTLRLVSDDIIVATLAAIADVGAATTVSAINDRLALNDGITNDQGAIAAKGIDVNARNGFYVQNSGVPGITGRDYANRRGLSFGALGLNIASQNSGLRIVINGQHIGAAGPVTGIDAIALIAINGATGATTGFDAGSTVNGCIIVNVGACRIGPDNGGPPIQDRIIEEEDEENSEGTAILVSPLITLRGLDPLAGEPLIDDPVTGAGNDDLWTPTASDAKD